MNIQKKQIVLLSLFCLLNFTIQARELFRGGMFLHTGYVKNQLVFPSVDGLVSGIGGKITFRTGNHWRIGTEGYVSNFGYKENEGQYKLGWGGLLAEYQVNNKRLVPVFGITAGAGKIHDLYVLSGNFENNDEDRAIYKVYSSFMITPHVSLELRMTDSINLVLKTDYLLYPGIKFPDFVANGPRLYFGVLFMR